MSSDDFNDENIENEGYTYTNDEGNYPEHNFPHGGNGNGNGNVEGQKPKPEKGKFQLTNTQEMEGFNCVICSYRIKNKISKGCSYQ